MRVAAWGALSGAILASGITAAYLRGDLALAELREVPPAERFVASGELIALSSDANETHQQVTVIDAKQRSMSVYHIERSTGKISLKSVRNLHWDLLMEEFNGTEPTVREIRAMLEQR
jgi:hypothetical protein